MPAYENGVMVGGVLGAAGNNAAADQVWDEALSGHLAAGTAGGGMLRTLTKTTTFTGASTLGLHGTGTTIATIAGGAVEVVRISGRVTTNLTGASGTLSLGVTGSLALFIATTVATTLVTTAANWVSATATTGGLIFPALCKDVLINANIVLQSDNVAADVTGGVLEINVAWRPITPGATLT